MDYYDLLEISQDSDVKTIKKAYKKKALKCHPDKNRNNPEANEQFQQLSKILEVLLDEKLRGAYDKELNAKKEAKLRREQMTIEKRKLLEQLEEAERQYELKRKGATEEQRKQKEIERLQAEGARLLEEENERIRKKWEEKQRKSQAENERKAGKSASDANSGPAAPLVVQWDLNKLPLYDRALLERCFNKHGDIKTLFLSKTKPATAVIEFVDPTVVDFVLRYERGLLTNPFKIKKMR